MSRWRGWLYAAVAVVSLLMWLCWRPLTEGRWEVADRHQLINAAYLLLAGGMWCGVLLAAAGLCGFGLLWLGARGQWRRWGDGWQTMWLAVGLGLTAMSLATLGLGLMGWLNRPAVVIMLAIMAAVGVGPAWRVLRSLPPRDKAAPRPRCTLLALVIVPLAMLGLQAALVPAGVLWGHDGKGYDVLEYHLQLPREYWQAGRISRIDHNIFSHLPANAEMLYLVGVILHDDAIEAMYTAQLLNYALGVMFVAGVGIFLRRYSRTGAVLAMVAVAGPQLLFVSTIAYVECYQMLMFLLAVGVLLGRPEAAATSAPAGHNPAPSGWGAVIVAGIMVGAACGAKYTGLVMILPVTAWFGVMLRRWRGRQLAVFLLSTLAVLGPWLAKNAAFTGNPVFPLAHGALGRGGYSETHLARWDAATQPTAERAALTARLTIWAAHMVLPHMYGVAMVGLLVVMLVAAVAGGDGNGRLAWVAAVALLGQMLIWLTASHLQPRFLLPILAPAAVAWAASWQRLRRGNVITLLAAVLAVAGGALHLLESVPAYQVSTQGFQPWVGRDADVAAWYPFGDPREEIAPGSKVLLVGEARPFYVRSDYGYNTVFDRCLLAEKLAAGGVDAALVWLRAEGYTHVHVHWAEVDRLRASYGFDEQINRVTFMALEGAGLETVEEYHTRNGEVFWVLYEIAVR